MKTSAIPLWNLISVDLLSSPKWFLNDLFNDMKLENKNYPYIRQFYGTTIFNRIDFIINAKESKK